MFEVSVVLTYIFKQRLYKKTQIHGVKIIYSPIRYFSLMNIAQNLYMIDPSCENDQCHRPERSYR